MKSLKSKITFIYISLVIIIALVGVSSAFSIYKLSKSINGLMTDNYKSINAVNNMIESIDNQNISILNYIYSNSPSEIDNFYLENDNFYKWYNIEYNNITEEGEKEKVKKINEAYANYSKVFSQLEEEKNKIGVSGSVEFYNTKVLPASENIKKNLRGLVELNEKAMFEGRNRVINTTRQYAYLVFITSLVLVIGGFVISKILTNKFLKPIYVLTETVKSIKEGDLNKQSPIISDDEIGDLANEFNKMTKRLMTFEQSTKGELINEKNRSLAIVKSIADPLIVLSTDYKILLLNDSCEKIFRVKEHNNLNKHFLEVIRENELFDYIAETLEQKLENNSKIMSFKLNNEEYYFNVLITTVRDTVSKVISIVILFQDITQLKYVEKLKSDFISTVSHEFKTPLTSIMIGTSLLMDGEIGELNERQQEVMQTIKEDGEKLTQLVTNLLQLSKVESDKAIFNIEPVSIEGIIHNCITGFYDLAENKDVNLTYNLKENLPKVNADSEKISWVINNLISNSIKFTNAGDDIEVTAYVKKNNMYIAVKDTGIGISENYIEKIFEKFVTTHENNSTGTGLGLTIAKEIVEIHGGKIWCESKPDVGSTFTFTLPLAK